MKLNLATFPHRSYPGSGMQIQDVHIEKLLTAAGQLRIYTGFPFNPCGLWATGTDNGANVTQISTGTREGGCMGGESLCYPDYADFAD